MRSRNIKPGFFKNEDLADLGPHAQLLFVGLWCLADREGRLEDRPKRIKAEIFPYEDLNESVDLMLDKLSETEFIKRYVVKDNNYIQITNFLKHQTPHYLESPSQIPAPDGHIDSLYSSPALTKSQRKNLLEKLGKKCVECGAKTKLQIDHKIPRSMGGTNDDENLQVLCASCNSRKRNKLMADARQPDVSLKSERSQPDVSVKSIVKSPTDLLIPDSLITDSLIPDTNIPPKKSLEKVKRVKTPIPDDFKISDAVREWAKGKGFDRLEEHFEAFKDLALMKGYEYLDWDLAFRRAIRENWGKINLSPQRLGEGVKSEPKGFDALRESTRRRQGAE